MHRVTSKSYMYICNITITKLYISIYYNKAMPIFEYLLSETYINSFRLKFVIAFLGFSTKANLQSVILCDSINFT